MITLKCTFSFIRNVISLIRVKQWIKNLFVFFPLIFAEKFMEIDSIIKAVTVFTVFSLSSSVIYVINDIFDIEKDRKHPVKRLRALCSGKISIPLAWGITALLITGAAGGAFFLTPLTIIIISAYIVMNLCYTIFLKHEVLFDVFIIAIGFVLRVIAGSNAIEVPFTYWIILVTFFVSLFLGFGKRRHELLFSGEEGGKNHRPVLEKYNVQLLDYLIIISVTMTIIAYSLYIIEVHNFVFTLPFVVYGLFRYMHIVYIQKGGGDPSDIVLKDKILIANIGAWGCSVLGIITIF